MEQKVENKKIEKQEPKLIVKKNKKVTEELIVTLKYDEDPSYHKYSSKKKNKSK